MWCRINVKLGGINVITDPTQVTLLSDPHNPTVVMGADVMHPGYGSPCIALFSVPHMPLCLCSAGTNGRPSYSAVVSSVDSNAAKYVTIQKVQASRQELISDLQMMTKVRAIPIHSNLGVNCIICCQYLLTKYMSYREAVEKVPLSKKAPKRLIFYRGSCLGALPILTI
jgi:eukaryotic translation initiation factor 2C